MGVIFLIALAGAVIAHMTCGTDFCASVGLGFITSMALSALAGWIGDWLGFLYFKIRWEDTEREKKKDRP